MKLHTKLAAIGAVALAAAFAYAPAAQATRVGFNVTFGGPGYAVNVGNYDAGYGYGYDYGYGYGHWAPAPVVVAPYVPYYRSYYAPAPVVVRPYPVYRPYDGWRQHRGDRYDGYRHHRGDRYDGYDGYRHRDRSSHYNAHYDYRR